MIRVCRDCHWWRQSPDEPKLGECQWTPPPMLLFFMNMVAPTDDVDRICITQAVEECSEFLAAKTSPIDTEGTDHECD